MPIPKEGSRKRQVYDVLQKDGAEKAVALGGKLGLSPGTVRSWLGAWGKRAPINGAAPTKDRPTTARSKPTKDDQESFRPDFRFSSHSRAETEARMRCELLGMDPRVFVVVGPTDGKWAFVPIAAAARLGADVKKPSFKVKDRVFDLTSVNRVGTVVDAGDDVCEVKWDGGANQFCPNYYLDHSTKKPVRVKRVEAEPGSEEATKRISSGIDIEADKARAINKDGKTNNPHVNPKLKGPSKANLAAASKANQDMQKMLFGSKKSKRGRG